MKTLIAIDPGKHGLGVALFGDGSLIAAKYSGALGGQPHTLLEAIEPFEKTFAEWRTATGWPIDSVVIERPQTYQGAKALADPRDILDLTIVVGALMQAVKPWTKGILIVYAGSWKGQVPPDICIDRAKNALTEDERAGVELPKASIDHNVWDAIALGLWHEGRILKR